MKTGDDNSKEKEARPKVNKDVARDEVLRFLDAKRVPENKRADGWDTHIDQLAALVVAGSLVFEFEKKSAVYNLAVPITSKDGETVTSLRLRFFMGVQQGLNALKDCDAGDVEARSMAMISALCGKAPAFLQNAVNELGEKGLDMGDHHSLKNYAMFFLA